MKLLEEKHFAPSKALLRILTELIAKLLWCLYIPSEVKGSGEDILIQSKINRWRKDTLLRIASGMKEFGFLNNLEDDSDILKKAQELCIMADSISDKGLPSIKDIFRKVPSWYEDVYLRAYWQFNSAIHPDFSLIGSIIKVDGNSINVDWDIAKNTNDLYKYCVVCAYHLNFLARVHYQWSIDSMKDSYKELMDSL